MKYFLSGNYLKMVFIVRTKRIYFLLSQMKGWMLVSHIQFGYNPGELSQES